MELEIVKVVVESAFAFGVPVLTDSVTTDLAACSLPVNRGNAPKNVGLVRANG